MLRAAINRFPVLKSSLKRLRARMMRGSTISSDYVELDREEAGRAGAKLRPAWKNDALPRRQRSLVDRQLESFRCGKAVDVFNVLVGALRELPGLRPGASVLEIGCSSGYYAEVFKIAGLNLAYTGCDYSEAFIALAREIYPSIPFSVEDATALRYGNASFDVAISGGCLLHIPEYQAAVAETARVAREYAIFHRTPVVIGKPTKYFRKQAYGVETVEIHFNEPELLALLEARGLALLKTYTLSEEQDPDDVRRGKADRTYVCRKARP